MKNKKSTNKIISNYNIPLQKKNKRDEKQHIRWGKVSDDGLPSKFFNVYTLYCKPKNKLKYPKTFAYVGTYTCAVINNYFLKETL